MSLEVNENNKVEDMISVEEYGILCFTNSYYFEEDLNDRKYTAITSKPSYFWIPVLAYLIKKTDLKIDDIKVFIELSLNSLMTKNDARWNNRALGVEGMLATLETVLFYSTRHKFESPVLEHQSLLGSFIDELIEKMERLGLIEDKNIDKINGAPVVMMGLLPLGFTKRTRLGESMFEKIDRIFKRQVKAETIQDSPYYPHYRFNQLWEIFKTSIFTMEEIYGPTRSKK